MIAGAISFFGELFFFFMRRSISKLLAEFVQTGNEPWGENRWVRGHPDTPSADLSVVSNSEG